MRLVEIENLIKGKTYYLERKHGNVIFTTLGDKYSNKVVGVFHQYLGDNRDDVYYGNGEMIYFTNLRPPPNYNGNLPIELGYGRCDWFLSNKFNIYEPEVKEIEQVREERTLQIVLEKIIGDTSASKIISKKFYTR